MSRFSIRTLPWLIPNRFLCRTLALYEAGKAWINRILAINDESKTQNADTARCVTIVVRRVPI